LFGVEQAFLFVGRANAAQSPAERGWNAVTAL
jgi:hypothetical protein